MATSTTLSVRFTIFASVIRETAKVQNKWRDLTYANNSNSVYKGPTTALSAVEPLVGFSHVNFVDKST